MNVAQLIQRLSAFPADMPVVLAARDEPVGDYEVMTVARQRMAHDPTYDDLGERVWHYASASDALRRFDPAREVVFLDFEAPPQGVVDAAVPVAALETRAPAERWRAWDPASDWRQIGEWQEQPAATALAEGTVVTVDYPNGRRRELWRVYRGQLVREPDFLEPQRAFGEPA
ncbi:hypothetical protein [Nocardia farcinica]|uniref:hypothetical protein n=1 Tax=Nocardia farcinica TaxID=37329 RepID=UPI001893A7B6|nr:hypothetical protein [Nocardia farcinica]MBF6411220.1 hypothetical protein [Nocardia farcinica]